MGGCGAIGQDLSNSEWTGTVIGARCRTDVYTYEEFGAPYLQVIH